MGTGVTLSELISLSLSPLIIKDQIVKGFVTSQLLLSHWNPAPRLLGASSHHFQRQITRKAQVFNLLILIYRIKEYGQASRPISTD